MGQCALSHETELNTFLSVNKYDFLVDICSECNQVNCKCSNQLLINSRESHNNNDYEVSTDCDQSDCNYHLSTFYDASDHNNFIYSNATIVINGYDHSVEDNDSSPLQPSSAKNTKNNNLSKSDDRTNMKSLKFASLNVCGLKRKVLFPEFSSLINNYDVFSISETKLDIFDLIELPGYTFFSQCRKQKYKRKSGGIGVFVKQSLFPHVSLIESDSDYVLWLSISKRVFNTDEDIYLGAIYIPPNDSRFYSPDEIENFEVEITNMCVENK